MSQITIRAKFMNALKAFAAAHNPVLTIAREGVGFTKPDGNSFLEATLIPSDPIAPTTDGVRKRYFGEFQINVWTVDNVGTGVAEAIAEEIAALFPVVPKTYLPVSVEQPPSIKKAIDDVPGWIVIPVCIPYRAEF